MIPKPVGTLPKFKRGLNATTAAEMNTLVEYAKAGASAVADYKDNANKAARQLRRLAKLTGYAPGNNAYTGRFISAAGVVEGENEPGYTDITFYTQRAPFTRTLLQCLPDLSDNFNSNNPDAWVPVYVRELCDNASPDNPCEAAWYVDAIFIGAGCS